MNPETIKSEALKDVLEFGTSNTVIWSDDDLKGILTHQLKSSLIFDLAHTNEFIMDAWQHKLTHETGTIHTFADALNDQATPIALLDLIKRYFKPYFTDGSDGTVPKEVAGVLYYSTITAALVHGNQRITHLNDTDLRVGLTWALSKSWIDPMVRQLLEQGLLNLQSGHSTT